MNIMNDRWHIIKIVLGDILGDMSDMSDIVNDLFFSYLFVCECYMLLPVVHILYVVGVCGMCIVKCYFICMWLIFIVYYI